MLCYLMLIADEDDQSKFEKIYVQYRDRMQYVAFGILQDEQEAENMVHDTFVTLIDYLDKIEDIECHRTWNYIVTILKNKCFNHLKRSKKINYMDENDMFEAHSQTDVAGELEQREIINMLAEEILKLEFPYKEVLYLYYYNDMTSPEIARLLELSADNVRQIMKRARNKLKKSLLERGYRQ